LALIGALVEEFVAGTGRVAMPGTAYEILNNQGYQLEIPRMFAAMFLITAQAYIFWDGRPVEASHWERGTTASSREA